jgi:choline monooxygenase
MYVSSTKLPHLLSPQDYFTERSHEQDIELLKSTWHFVGTTAELSNDGDFLTTTIASVPVQVRNFKGKLSALSNVCAHRHAIICSAPCGRSATMRCQYHGWEYQEDGRTGKIPEPKNFVPFDREQTRLPVYSLETVGQLMFVNLDPSATSLIEFLGSDFHDQLQTRFSDNWKLALRWGGDYPANWKVPVENSLESYHVPNVHPNTFREDPGSGRSEHGLHSNRTWFKTQLPFSPHSRLDSLFQRIEGLLVSWMGYDRNDTYEQHHVFPNLLFSFTDAVSFVQSVHPTTSKQSRAVVRQFGRLPANRGWRSGPARVWAKLKGSITRHILLEDMAIFTAIQQGLEASPHQGVLGICEERIHRFQEFMLRGRRVK